MSVLTPAAGLPSPRELRTLAAYLDQFYQLSAFTDLVSTKNYEAAQQLCGARDVINDLNELAVELEDAEANAMRQD